jgi:TRAP-type transport system periplasmic protein
MVHRSRFLAGSACAFASIAVLRAPPAAAAAAGAPFQYKFGTDTAIDHPITVRAIEMFKTIARETSGRLQVQVFPNSMLGGDPAMIAQMRSGALQFNVNAGAILSAIVPLAAIESVPFAFKSSKQVLTALDGSLGAVIRKEIERQNIHVFPKVLENGFRQITTSNHPIRVADDLQNVKLRTPPAKLWVDFFHALGASVASITLGEVYTALQTHVVDGQENPYTLIEFQRFYEVQKYLSVTNHMWGGYWLMCNGDAWRALPPDIQAVVEKNAAIYAERERRDNALYNASLADKLRRQGLAVNAADVDTFKRKLRDFYAKAKSDFGATAWDALERYAGKLA